MTDNKTTTPNTSEGNYTRGKLLTAFGSLTVGGLAGCSSVSTDGVLVVEKGVTKGTGYVEAWTELENTNHPTETVAQVYLSITDDSGTVIGPKEMVNPPLKERITRASLRWYPSVDSMVTKATSVEVDIAGTYATFFGSNNGGCKVVDRRPQQTNTTQEKNYRNRTKSTNNQHLP